MEERFFITTGSESASRAALLPTSPSEDASHLLSAIDLPAAPPCPAQDEFLPATSSEWVVELHWENSVPRSASELDALFRLTLWEHLDQPSLYGKDAATGKWTFLISADGPEYVTSLQFAWPYYQRSGGPESQSPPPERSHFEDRLAALRGAAAALNGAVLRALVPPVSAISRAAVLAEISKRFEDPVFLQLKAPFWKKFQGKQIWDVMLCLGLPWGDMDCFHCPDPILNVDYLFTVATSTSPGYFLPEEVAEGRVKVADLIFEFSLPRTAHPEAVFQAMWAATEYSRKRLGGRILDATGNPADPQQLLSAVKAEAAELRAHGFAPGSSEALRFF